MVRRGPGAARLPGAGRRLGGGPLIPETPSEVRTVLAERGISPRKRLGQHFLADPNLRDAIVAAAGVGPGDRVLEVGPGLGTLTRGLLDAGAEVLGVEVDRGLAAFLAEELRERPSFRLHRGSILEGGGLAAEVRDALCARGGRFLVVSNLPYGVATPLLASLARMEPPPLRVVAMVQREVALRMAGRPGGPDYGPLAVLLSLRGEVRVLREVGGSVFVPRVKVRSAVVRFTPGTGDAGPALRAAGLAREAFLHRRKSLRSGLRAAGREGTVVDAALAEAGIEPSRRPETLTPQEFVSLSALLV